MKKVFLSLAVIAMFSFVACGGNDEPAADTTAQETTQIDEQVQNPVEDENVNADEMANDAAAETEGEVAE